MSEPIIQRMEDETDPSLRLPGRLLLECLAIAILTKLSVFLFCELLFPFAKHPTESILSIWNRWDAKHYLQIAESGYSAESIPAETRQFHSHFPPLFPLFIRAIEFLTGLSILQAGMLSSFITMLLSTYLLTKLCWLEFKNERMLPRAVLMFHLYPVGHVLIAPYSEGLFLVWAMAFFLFMRHWNNLFLASFAFSLALATRFPAITLGAPFLWHLRQEGSGEWKKKTMTAALGPAIVLSAILFLNWIYWGDALYFVRYSFQDPQHRHYPILPLSETFRTLVECCKHFFHGTLNGDFFYRLGAGALLTFLALALSLIGFFGRMLPLSYSVYSFAYILFYASLNWGISNARYSFGAFPIFFVLAQIRLSFLFWGVALIFGAGLLTFSLHFVEGYWTF